MKYFKLNIGTKLFILYFLVSSTLVWAFAHRTSIESAKEVMVEVATMFSKIASQNIKDDEIIVTSDTVVWVDGEALGKPKDRIEAVYMLQKLSGKSHEVITAFTLKTVEKTISDYAITKVFFKELNDFEINYYIDNYKPFDKAGAYGIQEWIGLIGINKIEGSYFNVVGLPVDKLYKALTLHIKA